MCRDNKNTRFSNKNRGYLRKKFIGTKWQDDCFNNLIKKSLELRNIVGSAGLIILILQR